MDCDSRSHQNNSTKGQVAEMTKSWLPVTNRRYFVVMDALGNVLVLILHCHENGDCQEPDDRQSERSRVSELFQSADVCHSELSRVSSESHDRQDAQAVGRCHDQDDACIFCFLNSSDLFSLTFHFSFVLDRWFSNDSSRTVTRIGKCQDTSVGRNHRSLFRSSRALTNW